jgi:C-terminal processing protease CtpA/Prc
MSFDHDAPRPRLCHVRKSPHFTGYGFNLHAEKDKPGQYIGKVDDGSPAEAAGLREGDRIIEVNGTNIGNENHAQVVERIKAVPDEVLFLVVDPDTDAYYHKRNIIITGDMENIPKLDARENSSHSGSRRSSSASESDRHGVTAMQYDLEQKHDDDDDAGIFHARLCELRIWPNFHGFGLVVRTDGGKYGHFISRVEHGSPAEAAGLKEGDRIVEIDGHHVDDDDEHDEVGRRIEAFVASGRVTLLVVDSDADDYFHEHHIEIHGSMAALRRVVCPELNPLGRSIAVAAATAAAEKAAVHAVHEALEDHRASSSSDEDAAAARDHLDRRGSDDDESSRPLAAAAVAAAVETIHHPHRARLCVVRSWKDGRGYGFNMQAHRGKSGQFVGKVDAASPASLSGLRDGDRIIEVNGSNVEKASHKEVVEKIKSKPDEVVLLVVDADADAYFTTKAIVVTSVNDGLCERIVCPDTKPAHLIEAAVDHKKKDDKKTDSKQHPHRIRLCELRSWKDGRGYGFNLLNKPNGHFIGKVDDESPALVAGLLDGDRVIEVNGVNVEKASHKEVVENIKSKKDEVRLLVVDPVADKYFTAKSVALVSTLDIVEKVVCPDKKPKKFPEKKSGGKHADGKDLTVNVTVKTTESDGNSASPTSPGTRSSVIIGGIEFAETAGEARKRVSKKQNAKTRQMSIQEKCDLFNKL